PRPWLAENLRLQPSPATRPAPISLGSSVLSRFRVEVLQLHLRRLARWPPQLHRSPALRISPKTPPRAWTLASLKRAPIPIPPITEARRIVELLAGMIFRVPRICSRSKLPI